VTLTGEKLIGTSPDVIKYSASHHTGASGETTISDMEWDTYTRTYAGSNILLAQWPFQSAALAPGEHQVQQFILSGEQAGSITIQAERADTGAPVNATVTVTGTAIDGQHQTGWATETWSDWSGGINTANASGVVTGTSISLAPQGGPFSTTSVGIVESATIDLGGAGASAQALHWVGVVNSQSIRFQVAASDTGNDWMYVGPDDGVSSYFTEGGTLPESVQGKRYIRYKAYLETTDENASPRIDAVSLTYSGPCTLTAQYYHALAPGTYTVTVTASGMQTEVISVTVGSTHQRIVVPLNPL
jgi:hypothetical protein